MDLSTAYTTLGLYIVTLDDNGNIIDWHQIQDQATVKQGQSITISGNYNFENETHFTVDGYSFYAEDEYIQNAFPIIPKAVIIQ